MEPTELKWDDPGSALDAATALAGETRLGIRLPDDLRRFLCLHARGIPTELDIPLENDRKRAGSIGRFLSLDPTDSLYVGTWASKLKLASGLIPVIEAAGGDYVCLDTRCENACIVYWHHERVGAAEVTVLANTFHDFIKLLREPDLAAEEELDSKGS